MEYYAHKTEDGRRQTIKEHLKDVAELAKSYAIGCMKDIAYVAGYTHDIGKYAPAFQRRLEGSREKYEHAVCGALEFEKMYPKDFSTPMLEYCIAGHHTGLPDGGTRISNAEDTELQGRLRRADRYRKDWAYSAYSSQITLRKPEAKELEKLFQAVLEKTAGNREKYKEEFLELYSFFTRYLFSCLTDADFLDTERFCNPSVQRKLYADFYLANKALENKFSTFTPETQLMKARGRLQEQAFKNSITPSDINILNMPTGSGKTLCSLKIAVSKLLKDKTKKRIIYVIPYTSIIEQTAELFEDIFGLYVDILQHHSNYCFETSDKQEIFEDEDSQLSVSEKLKRSAENWDAPFIITTNVQFFQSLYHYKGSGLRKFHNIADSILVFDEIHLLPIDMLQPCLRGIGYVTKYLNCEAIFLSATMPDYGKLFSAYLPECIVNDLLPDKSDFRFFHKCRYYYIGRLEVEALLERTCAYQSSLIVVNTRQKAREIFHMAAGEKYHLSTYMTPADRSKTIYDIRTALKAKRSITVVSTSLIEAGVDLDFTAVFRQMAGLDSILQAGGRCNRDGREECGNVVVFELDETYKGDMGIAVDIVKNLFQSFDDISSIECIEEYYHRLHDTNADIIERNSIAKGADTVLGLPFRTYAESFAMIKDEAIGIVINNSDEVDKLMKRLKGRDYSVKRKLQRFTVSLRYKEFDDALRKGLLHDSDTGVFELSNPAYYDKKTGLDLDKAFD